MHAHTHKSKNKKTPLVLQTRYIWEGKSQLLLYCNNVTVVT